MESFNQHVRVFIRIRPTDNFAVDNIEITSDSNEIIIRACHEKLGYINNRVLDWNFRTNGVLHNVSQEEVFERCASKQVSMALEGYNATLFMYGQTGAGKTYTMTGTTNNFEQRGIIPRAINQLFSQINLRQEHETTVRISYLEIYKDQIFDLLACMHGGNACELSVSEDENQGTYVKGLSYSVAKNEEEALNMLFEGESSRMISSHQLNRLSSRSHCIFTIHIESHCITESETRYLKSKLNLVDLAGSERLGKSLSEDEAQKEVMHINKSLTFLEQIILSLGGKRCQHIPYRQSKLTHVLKSSLGGKCSTVMIGTIWGEKDQLEETLSTLQFAARVMSIPSKPTVNSYQDPVRMCKMYEQEILQLRKELSMYDILTNRKQISYEPLNDVQIKDIRQQVRKYLDDDISDIEVTNLRQVQEAFRQLKLIVTNIENEMKNTPKENNAVSEKVEIPGAKGIEVNQVANERTGLVGETDKNSFSVGSAVNVKPAVPSAVAATRKKNKKPKESSESDRKTSSSTVLESHHQNHSTDTKQYVEDPSITQVQVDIPPTKEEAFETFKTENGSTLNKIFLDNKEILNEKKQQAKQLSLVINETKESIDKIKCQLNTINEGKHFEREMMSTGELILDEDEYNLMCDLSSYKRKYRENYDSLQTTRSDIDYCESLVNHCRKKLLLEFDSWYISSFKFKESLSTDADVPPLSSEKVSFLPKEDHGERFGQIQNQLLMKNPDSVAFYNARIQTERQKLYGSTADKRPGSITSKIRNAPPRTMIKQ